MSESKWRQTILDQLRERNKRESGFQEIVNNSEFLCYGFSNLFWFCFYCASCYIYCVFKTKRWQDIPNI